MSLTMSTIKGGEPTEENEFLETEYGKQFNEIGKYLRAPWKEVGQRKTFQTLEIRFTKSSYINGKVVRYVRYGTDTIRI